MGPYTVTATLNTAGSAALQGNSYVRFILRGFEGFVPRVQGSCVVVETQIDAFPNSSGQISQLLWGNTDISPTSTFYTIQWWNNGRITSSGNYVIDANTDLDVSEQLNAPPVPDGFKLILQNNGALNSSNSLLNLESTDHTVTITDRLNGNIDLSAGGGSGGSPKFRGWNAGASGPVGCSPIAAPSGYTKVLTSFPLNPLYSTAVPASATTTAALPVFATPCGSTISITAWSITSNVATFTAANTAQPTEQFMLSGFGSTTAFNGTTVTITSATSTSFVCPLSHANGSNTEAGSAFPIDTLQLTSAAPTSWNVTSNVLQLNAVTSPVGSSLALEKFTTGSFLNGQVVTVSFQAAGGLTAAYTSANDSATEQGYIFANGTYRSGILGWNIVSNVLTIYAQSASVLPTTGATFTVGGLVHGSYLNGVTFTVASALAGFVQAPFTHSNANATETGKMVGYLPYSSTILNSSGSFPGISVFSMGVLGTFTSRAALQATGQGRFWLGVGDAAYTANNTFVSYYRGSMMAADSLPFSFVGFRYSPTNASDTTWKCVCNSGGVQTVVDSGVAVNTNDHIFSVSQSGGSVLFAIDGNTVGTISTNVPSSSTVLGDVIWADNQGSVANYSMLLVRYFDWSTTV